MVKHQCEHVGKNLPSICKVRPHFNLLPTLSTLEMLLLLQGGAR